jgi:hypothetical protein
LGQFTSSTLEVASLVQLAGGGVDVTTLRLGDGDVVAGTSTANGHLGTRELVADALVNTRLVGWKDDVSMLSQVPEAIEGIMDLTSDYRLQAWFLKHLLLSLPPLPCFAAWLFRSCSAWVASLMGSCPW